MKIFNKKAKKLADLSNQAEKIKKKIDEKKKQVLISKKENLSKTSRVDEENLFGEFSNILIRSLSSEKAKMLQGFKKYVFEVDLKANKQKVREAIKAVFKIEPLKINIIKIKGKVKKHKRSQGKTKNWRKAIVTLKEGETIKEMEK